MRALLSLLIAASVALTAGCASLPPPPTREVSSTYTHTGDTRLGEVIAPVVAANPGRSGIHAMANAFDAFAARMVLASQAQRSIDAQYFMWQDDQVGMMLFQALWQAAERGVRVRLLLDDGGTSGIDATLALLDAHPNIELRLYNPFGYRGSRTLGYLSDFQRLNKRMHNKSFTVDNLASVVGGRNIADEYFGAAAAAGFADLDVLMVGPVVQQVSVQFDRYWNSASAYAAAGFVAPPAPDAAARPPGPIRAYAGRAGVGGVSEGSGRTPVPQAGAGTASRTRLDDGAAAVRRPGQDAGPQRAHRRAALPALMQALGEPKRSLDIVSPYSCPATTAPRCWSTWRAAASRCAC